MALPAHGGRARRGGRDPPGDPEDPLHRVHLTRSHRQIRQHPHDLGLELIREHVQQERAPRPQRFPARLTLEACEALVRLHQLPGDGVHLVQQNPDVIDQGV
ncbi:MAG: N-succinylarginine dihydrolase, partial [Myxococcales bacterium]|nr:N-succinylarginine dihydrolase [Myxococcales bacterium]